MATPVTVNDVLDGHVGLDLECLDRIYLNGYVPNLQVGGQVVTFLTRHLGNPIPSPALLGQIGDRFRAAVARFARDEHLPVVRFAKDARKTEVMKPYMAARRWSRSGLPRSSSGCSPATTGRANPEPCASGSTRPTGE